MLLLIGYGNPLREDDGIGQLLAEHIAQCLAPAQAITAHQLTPELVQDIRYASLVVFIDARDGGTPGTVAGTEVIPATGTSAFTHHVTPASLLAAARDFYGTAPVGLLITVCGASFNYSTSLSPVMRAQIPAITSQTLALIDTIRSKYHA